VRQPASFCGVVGFKPTYGRVSRYGLVAYGSSLDQIGPVTKDMADAALLYSVIAGHDPLDSTSLPDSAADSTPPASSGPLRIGVPQEYFGPGLDPEVRACVENALKLLEKDGHTIVSISLPHTEYAVATYYIVATAEASANLARYDGVRYGFRAQPCDDVLDMYARTRAQGFGSEVKRRIILGTYVLSSGYYDAYYLRAQKVRTLIRNDFKAAFEKCDVIAHPVAPTPAFKIGEKTDDPLAMYLGDIYSVTANLAGLPAISIPCGKNSKGLPVGIQFAANTLNENTLFRMSQMMKSSPPQ
jgi:aspartyl-tRNA(Asn)/glutamyl-tRNA(Gln) amidotransferase subunit A